MSEHVFRMSGTNRTDFIKPSVTLVSCTDNPVETVFSMWHGSRYKDAIHPIALQLMRLWESRTELQEVNVPIYTNIRDKVLNDYGQEYPDKSASEIVDEVVKTVIKLNVPPVEAVQLTFQIDNASVAWREQLVRGRLGQSFWTQTSRTADMREMDVTILDSVRLLGGDKAVEVYKNAVQNIRDAYKELVDLGVPQEDIRLQPQSNLHRVYWTINLRSLITIIGKRTSWISQSSLWLPIIAQIVKSIREKHYDLYKVINHLIGQVDGVKIENGKVVYHSGDVEQMDRYVGTDPIPVDPLWLAYKGYKLPKHTDMKFYNYMKSLFIEVWSDEYLKVLGWDRKNPQKVGPYDLPEE